MTEKKTPASAHHRRPDCGRAPLDVCNLGEHAKRKEVLP